MSNMPGPVELPMSDMPGPVELPMSDVPGPVELPCPMCQVQPLLGRTGLLHQFQPCQSTENTVICRLHPTEPTGPPTRDPGAAQSGTIPLGTSA
ncbi:hypothetical protein UY3_16882 [Chelonia mydas]|uniref:Uncharacterized protein n=1 Tax=Chelonia mydas TaxID=8469 RepID=M7B1R6_CHEMY|nr:hypothetical protein UY3_16882 [Chelonia mydas]